MNQEVQHKQGMTTDSGCATYASLLARAGTPNSTQQFMELAGPETDLPLTLTPVGQAVYVMYPVYTVTVVVAKCNICNLCNVIVVVVVVVI